MRYTIEEGLPYTTPQPSNNAYIWPIIAIILSIIGGILLYFLFVKRKDEPKNKTLKWFKDFLSFKIMWIEPILKVIYYISTIFIILLSFSFLGSDFLSFIIFLLVGPIIARVVYEAAIMFIMIWRNTQDISDNTKKK